MQGMKELSLFSGAGGGLLATHHLLGWETVGYVEFNEYCQKVIAQRIKDGLLDNAPIFGDIRAFVSEGYAASYTGMVDVVSGGVPCQDISSAGGGKELMGRDLECGHIWPLSWGRYDHDMSLWKIHQCSLLADSEEFLETWPRWGLMRDGEFWGHATPVGLMDGREFGLSLPTPLKSDGMKFLKFKKSSVLKATFGTHVHSIPYAMTARYGRIPTVDVISWVMGWPIGWTSLRPLEMVKFQSWQQQHGAFCRESDRETNE